MSIGTQPAAYVYFIKSDLNDIGRRVLSILPSVNTMGILKISLIEDMLISRQSPFTFQYWQSYADQ